MSSTTSDTAKGRAAPAVTGRILRIEVPVIAVLAQKRVKMGEILDWSVGSIIQLNKHSEELLDLMVNDQRIGRGETVRIGENFGLQIAEMGAVQDTIRKLGVTAPEPPPETADEEPVETSE